MKNLYQKHKKKFKCRYKINKLLNKYNLKALRKILINSDLNNKTCISYLKDLKQYIDIIKDILKTQNLLDKEINAYLHNSIIDKAIKGLESKNSNITIANNFLTALLLKHSTIMEGVNNYNSKLKKEINKQFSFEVAKSWS